MAMPIRKKPVFGIVNISKPVSSRPFLLFFRAGSVIATSLVVGAGDDPLLTPLYYISRKYVMGIPTIPLFTIKKIPKPFLQKKTPARMPCKRQKSKKVPENLGEIKLLRHGTGRTQAYLPCPPRQTQ